MSAQFPHLMSSLRIGNIEVRNRMVSTAHATWLGSDHHPTPALAAYQVARARGGIGLIVLENSRVHPTSRGGRAALEAWHEDFIPHYRQVADAVHTHGAKIIAQLIHTGLRTASMDSEWPIWGPSGTRLPWFAEVPHEMTQEEIAELQRWWARCAVNMKQAGMDGVEIHGAHGFLVAQFLSPVTNHRTDSYGGNLQHRSRFALELVRAVRQAVGRDFVVGFRISADELLPGGLQLQDTRQVARWLEQTTDLNYLSVSHSAEYDHWSAAQQFADMYWDPAPFVHLAAGIKEVVKDLPVITACRIFDPAVAENILREGKADLVAMTRAHIADPEIGKKILEGRADDIRQCIGSNQGCVGRSNGERHTGCVINPEAGREYELGALKRVPQPKAIVVVGGGPAGMEAARVAALRGHLVALYERDERLGGQINTLTKAPYRQEFGNIVAWLELQLKRLGVVVKLSTEATVERLVAEGAEAVIVATGAAPQLPGIAGVNGGSTTRVVSVEDVLGNQAIAGKRAILLDEDNTHRAASTAEYLASMGTETHFVVRSQGACSNLHSTLQATMNRRLAARSVVFHRGHRVQEVRGHSVLIEDVTAGKVTTLDDVDVIVAASPSKPYTDLYSKLKSEPVFAQVLMAGDCIAPRQVTEAIREGYLAGRAI